MSTPQSILPTELYGALMRFVGFAGIGKSYLAASMESPGLIDYVDFESKARAIAVQLERRGTPFGAYNAINEQVAGKGALAMFDMFRKHIDSIKQDQFTTMVLDNVAELQKAAVAHVEANAKQYAANSSLQEKFIKSGNAGQQYSAASIAFANLFSEIRDKGVQLIICVSHIGPMWKGGKTQVPGKFHVGGVKILDTLSSLSLILMKPRPETERWPPPAALVSKESLGTFSVQTELTSEQIEDIKRGEIPSHIMAPRFPRRIWPCTSQVIKRYLAHPADYKNLDEHEIPTDDELFMFSEKLSKEQMSFVLNSQALDRMEKAQTAVPTRSVNPQSLIARAQQAQPESPQITQAKVDAGKLRSEGQDMDQIRAKLRETYPPPVVAAAVRDLDEAPF